MTPPRIAIIGGGITGLATTWELRKRLPDAVLHLYEAAPRFGGKITTRTLEGCIVEGGPDSLLTEKPWGIDLCRELGLGGDLLPSNDAQRSFSILHKGRLHPFPAGCKLFIPQKVTPILTTRLLSLPGKVRMLAEPLLPHQMPEGDESLANFTRRHFGQQALERLAGPLLGGMYGGDPEDMSMAATFPRLRDLERKHRSLVKGMAHMMRQARNQAKTGTPPGLFTTLRHGMQQLPDALVARLTPHLRPDHPVQHLEKTGDTWRVDGESYDRVILALPARASAKLLHPLAPALAADLQQQSTSSSATLSLVFERNTVNPLPTGFGFMAAHPLESLLVGCTWTGNKFSGRESDDTFVCRAFLGGPQGHTPILEHSEADLVQAALDALRRICPFLPPTPRAHWLQRWPRGNPGYALGHLDWVANLHRQSAELGHLHLVGSSFEGISVSDCIKQARDLAESIAPGPKKNPPDSP